MAATTSLLGLVTPTQGDLSGTWGNTVNNGITEYVDIAVAGTLTLTNDGAVTLANTLGSASASLIVSSLTGAGTVTAQFAIVKVTGTLTTPKIITGPSYSKTYLVVNAATGSTVSFIRSGQVTAVSIAVGETAFVYFNGTDYVKVVGTATAGAAGGSTTQVQFNSSGILAGSANMTFNGTTLTVNDLTDSSLTATRVVFAGTAGNLTNSANLTWNGTSLSATQIDITAQGQLRLQDTTGGEYVALRAPATLGANYTLTFPADDGTSGQALITDGSGVLSWSTAASGDVYGPASATANGIVLFDGTTGKIIKDSAAQDGLIYGLTVGRGGGAVASNTVVGGHTPLNSNTTGTNNVAIGDYAGQSSTGSFNTLLGSQAGFFVTGSSNVLAGYQAGNNGGLSGSNNVGIGQQALYNNTTASNNTAVGYQAGYTNTTGAYNVAVGAVALYTNTTGAQNVAIGGVAMNKNTTGSDNTAVGLQALQSNTTASNNAAFGTNALYYNTTGGANTALGKDALLNNTTASYNTAVGYQAGYTNTTGALNVAVGTRALQLNSTSSDNTAVGYEAAQLTTGAANTAMGKQTLGNNTSGANNTAVGAGALISNTTASNNTAVGYQAGYLNTTGADSTFLGFSAGYNHTTGSRNTLVGFYAGAGMTTGTFNNFLGTQAGQAVTTGGKNTVLGSYSGNQGGLDIRTASNYAVISDGDGNRLISTANGQTLALDSAVPNAGTGITFPATQSASSNANTLDDYEEGTWTPVLTGDGGGTAMTYATQIGKYTKIGNVITADAYILLSARGTITGNVVITGLPFTGNSNYNSSVNWGYWSDLATSWASVGGWLNSGNTIYCGGQKTSNTIIQTMAQADIANNSRINVQVTYTLS